MYEAQLEQIDNNILRINEQQLMLENSQTTIVTLSTLGEAAKAAKVTQPLAGDPSCLLAPLPCHPGNRRGLACASRGATQGL